MSISSAIHSWVMIQYCICLQSSIFALRHKVWLWRTPSVQPSISLPAFQWYRNICNKFHHNLHNICVLVTYVWEIAAILSRPQCVNKISCHLNSSPLLIFHKEIRYILYMTISKFDLGNSWPRSQARSGIKVKYETNQPNNSHCFSFAQIGPCILNILSIYHLTLRFRGQGHYRAQDQFISQFSGHFDGNWGTNRQQIWNKYLYSHIFLQF